MSELSEIRLDDIEQRIEAAHPGPWVLSKSGNWVTSPALRESMDGDLFRVVDGSRADAELVTNAPADLRELLAEVSRLRALIEEMHWDAVEASERVDL